METLLIDRVHRSLRLLMHRNAIFLCERLCAQFHSETNVQLLATCYLHNNQPYAAYHILKGKKLPESRYLFATSCFRMTLLREAEETLCPVNEQNMEVPCGATGHYLLGVIYRCTCGISAVAEQFTQAVSLDPLLWAAYEELCILGVAEDTDEYFNESTALRLQQEQTSTSTLVSGRLFNRDLMPQRSPRPRGNGTNHLSGSRYEVIDEMSTDNISGTSSSVSTADGRFFEQYKAERILLQDLKVALGTRELLGLFQTLGEAFRLSCSFKCQEALEVYRKLPESQFNTGWVLCQMK